MHASAWLAVLVLAKILKEYSLVPVTLESIITFSLDEKIKVLEIGSKDYNGNSKNALNLHFEKQNLIYVGMDMEEGPNVNLVYNPMKDPWPLVENQFDLVLSTSCFEHDRFFGDHLQI